MAQYTVQDPSGNTRVIEGPDGASDDEVISQAQKLFGQSGGMPQETGIDTLNRYIQQSKLNPQRPDPMQATFQQDQSYSPQSTSPFGQRLLENAGIVAGGYGLGNIGTRLGLGIANKVAGGIGSLFDTYKTAQIAPELAGTESASEAGTTIANAKATEEAANKARYTMLYSKLPADASIPLTETQKIADSLVNEAKDLPNSFTESAIMKKVSDLQNLDTAKFGTVQTIRSALGDAAANGEGVEKLYAARLSKAIQTDIENFSQRPVLPSALSQQPSLEAMDLRRNWEELAREGKQYTPLEQARNFGYVNPDVVQPNTSPLTNADVSMNLQKANAIYKGAQELKNNPLAQALDRAGLEDKANIIFKKGNASDVINGKAILGDTGFQAAQGQFYQKLLNTKDISTKLSKYDPEFLKQALTETQLKALQAVALMHKIYTGAKVAATGAAIGIPGVGLARKVFR